MKPVQPVKPEKLPDFLAACRTLEVAGFNATMPHKEALLPLMDGGLSDEAARFGAVNTVCIKDGVCCGHNTDGRGFLRALERLGVSPGGKRVLLLGAGGASKAVALSLADAGAKIALCNRSASRAETLCAMAVIALGSGRTMYNEKHDKATFIKNIINSYCSCIKL